MGSLGLRRWLITIAAIAEPYANFVSATRLAVVSKTCDVTVKLRSTSTSGAFRFEVDGEANSDRSATFAAEIQKV